MKNRRVCKAYSKQDIPDPHKNWCIILNKQELTQLETTGVEYVTFPSTNMLLPATN